MSVITIDKAIFRTLGEGARKAIFKNPISLDIGINHRWAITGPRKTELLEVLASKYVVEPPLAQRYPFLKGSVWPSQVTQLIEFSNAEVNAPHLSARYESLREEFDYTLNDFLLRVRNDQSAVDDVLKKFSLDGIGNRWVVGLSNGQSRRARLARALLRQPQLLLVDEPFVGLDPQSRQQASEILSMLPPSPHVILGLRYQDQFPSWITHVAVTDGSGIVAQGTVGEISPLLEDMRQAHTAAVKAAKLKRSEHSKSAESGDLIIDLSGVSVSYKGEKIFQDLKWQVRRGEKWHLRGDNGTGKSTLLAMLTADHPQSWNSKVSMFGEQRQTGKQSYFSINERIGHVAPEIHSLFPKNLTVSEALSTGFVVGSYLPLKTPSQEQQARIDELIALFDLDATTPLNQLSMSEQKVVLFLRGIIKRPDIVILDEAFSAMAQERIDQCKSFMDDYKGTVIAVGHLEDEIPACDKYIRLTRGEPEYGTVL